MNDTTTERPFEYLKRLENGEFFAQEIVNNWYEARAYVLDELKDVAFTPTSDGYLHAVILGDSPRMLSVARQIALSAHYINHDEVREDERRRCRTVITILNKQADDIRLELEKEEYLCNLPKYCKYVDADGRVSNRDSYIDIEIHVIRDMDKVDIHSPECKTVVFSDEKLQSFCESKGDAIYGIDTRMAFYASGMYELGADIDNLPAEDIHCTARYILALNTFQHVKLNRKFEPFISPDGIDGTIRIREILSNVFCTDTFESRERAINMLESSQPKKRSLLSFIGSTPKHRIWELNNESLSRSEHSRWVVEKLIMGYSPLNKEQRYMDESLSYDAGKRNRYRKSLKRDPKHPAHIDLCSYNELRCIDPDALKYDSFIVLGIPMILAKIKQLDSKKR